MSELKPFDSFQLMPEQMASFRPTYSMNLAEHVQAQVDENLRAVERAREEKDAEELRRHNEIVDTMHELNDTMRETVLEAIKMGASVNIDSNTGNINISMNSNNVSQEAIQNTEIDYDAAETALKEISEFLDIPKFEKDFGEQAEEVKKLVADLLTAVQEKQKPSLIKTGLNKLKSLAGGVTGSLIASAIFEGIKQIPGMM